MPEVQLQKQCYMVMTSMENNEQLEARGHVLTVGMLTCCVAFAKLWIVLQGTNLHATDAVEKLGGRPWTVRFTEEWLSAFVQDATCLITLPVIRTIAPPTDPPDPQKPP